MCFGAQKIKWHQWLIFPSHWCCSIDWRWAWPSHLRGVTPVPPRILSIAFLHVWRSNKQMQSGLQWIFRFATASTDQMPPSGISLECKTSLRFFQICKLWVKTPLMIWCIVRQAPRESSAFDDGLCTTRVDSEYQCLFKNTYVAWYHPILAWEFRTCRISSCMCRGKEEMFGCLGYEDWPYQSLRPAVSKYRTGWWSESQMSAPRVWLLVNLQGLASCRRKMANRFCLIAAAWTQFLLLIMY